MHALLERVQAKRAAAAAAEPSAAKTGKQTAFSRIRGYFKKVANQPSSTKVICMDTGLARGAVSNVISVTHADKFVSTYSRATKRKLWSMKAAELIPNMLPLTDFAQLIKEYALLDHGKYLPGEVIGTKKRPRNGNPDKERICTWHVEPRVYSLTPLDATPDVTA